MLCSNKKQKSVEKLFFYTFFGELGGTRTPNLLIRSEMLYPLSHESNTHFNGSAKVTFNLFFSKIVLVFFG